LSLEDKLIVIQKRVTALELWRQETEKLLSFDTPVIETTISAPIEPETAPDTPVTQKEVNPIYDYPPTVSDISETIPDFTAVFDYLKYGDVIKTKQFLKEGWAEYNEKLKTLGYGWHSDKETRTYQWEYGYNSEPTPQQATTGERRVSEVVSGVQTGEIEWKVKADGETVDARPGEKAWAFVKGYDRNAKKSLDTPKKNCESLYNYLQQRDKYNDGEYVYTMSKNEAFFNREPVKN